MDVIPGLLEEAGIGKDDPEWGHQYNQCHAALSRFGVSSGCDPRLARVLKEKGLGHMTEGGRKELIHLFRSLAAELGSPAEKSAPALETGANPE